MTTYKLNLDGSYALKFIEGVETGEWHNTKTSAEYLAWLAEGNEPLPAETPKE
jgi:hypothetical protein